MIVLVFQVASAVGAAACFRVGVGAGTFEFLFLVQQHFETEGSHHQCEDAHCYGEDYEYCLHFL